MFLDFFPVWGEHSVNHGWLCSGEDVHQVCGHRPLLHQSTVDLAQEWTPPRYCAQGPSISTKLQNESQVQLYFYFFFLHTNSQSQCILQPSLPLHHLFLITTLHLRTFSIFSSSSLPTHPLSIHSATLSSVYVFSLIAYIPV